MAASTSERSDSGQREVMTAFPLRIKLASPEEDLPQQQDPVWSSRETHAWMITLLMGTSALYSSRTTMPLVAPAVATEEGWSKTETGTVLSSFFWGYTLTQVVGGYLSDVIGGGRVLMMAAIGWSLLTFWMPQVIHLNSPAPVAMHVIVASRVLLGAFQGVHFPSMASLSSQNLGSKERASFYSAVTAGGAIGTVITGSVGSYVLDRYGWTAVFHTVGFLGMSWVLLLHYWAMAMQRRRLVCGTRPAIKDRIAVPWLTYFRTPAFWSCVIGHVCQNNGYFILLSWLPTYFHETFPEAKGWIFNTIPWVASIPAVFIGRWLTDFCLRRGCSVTATRKLVETLCLGTQAVSLILIGRVESFCAALACMTLALAASGFHNCSILVNPQDLAPRHAGSVFGLMNTAGAIPGFVGVYIAGYIMEVTKSWPAVFQMTALVNVFGCVVFNAFGSGKPIVT